MKNEKKCLFVFEKSSEFLGTPFIPDVRLIPNHFRNGLLLDYKTTYTPFISPNAQSLRTELHFQFIRFAAATLLFAFTPSVGIPHFGECGLRNGAR